jgi:hypothetical protein
MNPGGPVEETSKTAQVLIDSLKSSPVILALVLFNIIYIAMSGYVWVKIQEHRNSSEERWERLVENAMRWCPSTTIEKDKTN